MYHLELAMCEVIVNIMLCSFSAFMPFSTVVFFSHSLPVRKRGNAVLFEFHVICEL